MGLFTRFLNPRKTPRMIQMENVECGAAALGILLGYFGKHLPLQELRETCGVTRDGLDMEELVKAATFYGLEAEVYESDLKDLFTLEEPVILYWEYNHFLVLEEVRQDKVLINDPRVGHSEISREELEKKYGGLFLECRPGASFSPSGKRRTLISRVVEKVATYKKSLSFLLWIQVAIALLGLALPIFAQVFIDEFFTFSLPTWEWEFLGLVFGVMCLSGVVTWLQQQYLNLFQVRLSIGLSTEFIGRLLRLPVLFFTQRYSSELVNRMNLNTRIGEMLSKDMVLNSINILLLSSYWILMGFYSLSVTVLAAFVAFFNVLLVIYIGKTRSNSYAKLQQSDARAIGISFDAIEHIESMKGCGHENFFFSRIAGAYTQSINNTQEIGKKDIALTSLSRVSMQFSSIFILVFGSWRVIGGFLTVGELIALQILFNLFLAPILQMAAFSTQAQSLEVDLTRLDDVLKAKTDPFLEEREEGALDCKLKGELTFRDVAFGYKPLESPLIKNLNLDLKAGEMVGLTGPNGSGKSTLARLATSLYAPDEGLVLYDGKSGFDYLRTSMERSMAIIDQIAQFFPGTIRENLTLLSPDVTDERIQTALEEALLADDIAKLPLGLSTVIEDEGKNFSAGQLQRLEMARVLLKEPAILILDEATNTLDADREQTILENIKKRGITTLIISHRLPTFKQCDRILVLEKGDIVQDGTHEALSQREGPYKQLLDFEIEQKL